MPALAFLVPVVLGGCGGVASIGEDIGNAIGDGVICGLRNCTESSKLNLDEISPRFTATQAAGDNAVVITGSLGKSANLLTTVEDYGNFLAYLHRVQDEDLALGIAMTYAKGDRSRQALTDMATSCAEVSASCPMVHVINLPSDPAAISSLLSVASAFGLSAAKPCCRRPTWPPRRPPGSASSAAATRTSPTSAGSPRRSTRRSRPIELL